MSDCSERYTRHLEESCNGVVFAGCPFLALFDAGMGWSYIGLDLSILHQAFCHSKGSFERKGNSGREPASSSREDEGFCAGPHVTTNGTSRRQKACVLRGQQLFKEARTRGRVHHGVKQWSIQQETKFYSPDLRNGAETMTVADNEKGSRLLLSKRWRGLLGAYLLHACLGPGEHRQGARLSLSLPPPRAQSDGR